MPELKETLKTLKLNESTVSIVLGAVVVLIVGIMALKWFNGVRKGAGLVTDQAAQESAQLGTQPEMGPSQGTIHTVTQGENLWMISQKYYSGSGYNWIDIAKENKLFNASHVVVGQKLAIPSVAVRRPAVMAAPSSPTVSGSSYTTVRGDSLWKVSVAAYGDGFQWMKVYNANKSAIGRDPGKIAIGMTLAIPR